MAGPPNPRILPAFRERILWQVVEEDAKDRVVFTSGAQGDWWIAAWSGHTQDRVVGPAAIVPSQELPEVLIHGSYRRHTPQSRKGSLFRQRRPALPRPKVFFRKVEVGPRDMCRD